MKRLILILLFPLMLAACEGGNNKQIAGTAVGAAAGGLAGSAIGKGKGNTLAIIAGALIGGIAGNQVGAALDDADRERAQRSTQTALENTATGHTTSWRSPDSGNYGSTTPTRTYTSSNGQPCREYQSTVTVDGKTANGTGTACRDADGNWMIVS